MNPFNYRRLTATTMALCISAAAHAMTADRNQPITVDSDRAESDESKGITTYAGNVVMQQGSMRINAERIMIHNDKNKVTRIVAIGTPAKYQQRPSEKESLVIAQAIRLEYNIVQGTLHLIDKASLQQEGTSLTGNRIDYDVKKSVVKAGGNASQNERVKMVIPAKSLKQEEDE
jgi:lipopolysaccharide export system protein LptA